MQTKARDLLTHSWESQANISLFLILLVLTIFVLPSIGFEENHRQLYGDIAFTIILIFGTAVGRHNPRLFAPTVFISFAAIGIRWMAWWNPTHTLLLVSQITGFASVVAVMIVLLWQVFRAGPVTSTRIQAAIAVYLALAFGWAHAYQIAALLDSGAFRIAANDLSGSIDWIAFSFGMLTTAGYEGVVPVHPVAHSLASSEAVTGQLYLTVLVARLVSMEVSTSFSRAK